MKQYDAKGQITARYNIARFGSSADLDAAHIAGLGAEAVPVVLRHWDCLSARDRQVIGQEYSRRYNEGADWRGLSVSELAAAKAGPFGAIGTSPVETTSKR